MAKTTFLIGVDDTDNATSPGTGRLARVLSQECDRLGLAPAGVTRHQFLIDPVIPYTSHNSGACIAVECDNGLNIGDFVLDFVARTSADGSNPGVCITPMSQVPAVVTEFGIRATEQVVAIPEAFGLAKQTGITLYGLGRTCQGVIGALGSVGLRASGDNGRFIDLPGLRELSGCIGAEAFDRIGVVVEHRGCGRSPGANDRYETLDWVRPRLAGGKAVLPVQWSEEEDAWIPVDKKGHATG